MITRRRTAFCLSLLALLAHAELGLDDARRAAQDELRGRDGHHSCGRVRSGRARTAARSSCSRTRSCAASRAPRRSSCPTACCTARASRSARTRLPARTRLRAPGRATSRSRPPTSTTPRASTRSPPRRARSRRARADALRRRMAAAAFPRARRAPRARGGVLVPFDPASLVAAGDRRRKRRRDRLLRADAAAAAPPARRGRSRASRTTTARATRGRARTPARSARPTGSTCRAAACSSLLCALGSGREAHAVLDVGCARCARNARATSRRGGTTRSSRSRGTSRTACAPRRARARARARVDSAARERRAIAHPHNPPEASTSEHVSRRVSVARDECALARRAAAPRLSRRRWGALPHRRARVAIRADFDVAAAFARARARRLYRRAVGSRTVDARASRTVRAARARWTMPALPRGRLPRVQGRRRRRRAPAIASPRRATTRPTSARFAHGEHSVAQFSILRGPAPTRRSPCDRAEARAARRAIAQPPRFMKNSSDDCFSTRRRGRRARFCGYSERPPAA